MNQLVFIQNHQVITDSLTIAEMFSKDHNKVVRDIENQISKLKEAGEEKWGVANFGATQYQHPQNKQLYPKYNLTEDGFAIVAMSYTTPEAMKMKVKFIQEFKRMKEYIQKQEQLSQDPITLALESALETRKQVQGIQSEVIEMKADVEELKDNLYITSIQAKAIKNKVGEKVYESLGGKDSNAFKHLKSKLFAACWRDFKNYFDISEYRELPRVKFEIGMKFLFAWQPNTELRLEIEHYNTHSQLKLVK